MTGGVRSEQTASGIDGAGGRGAGRRSRRAARSRSRRFEFDGVAHGIIADGEDGDGEGGGRGVDEQGTQAAKRKRAAMRRGWERAHGVFGCAEQLVGGALNPEEADGRDLPIVEGWRRAARSAG